MAITKDDVFNAADAMEAAGEPVSTIKIRERLGTGSYATIAPFFGEWRAARSLPLSRPGTPVPDELAKVCDAVAGEAWAAAQRLLDERLEVERKAAVEKVKIANEEREAVLELADSLTIEKERLEASYAESSLSLAKLRESLNEMLSESQKASATVAETLEAANKKVQAAERLRSEEVAKAQALLSEKDKELSVTASLLEQSEKTTEKLAARLDKAEAQIAEVEKLRELDRSDYKKSLDKALSLAGSNLNDA